MDIREPKNILVFSYGHVFSYCSICTRYIEFSCSSSKRNENDITKRKHIKQTTTTTITSIGQEWSLQNNPLPSLILCCVYICCNNQKDFILWMRRINLIGYKNLYRFIQYVMISNVQLFYDTKKGMEKHIFFHFVIVDRIAYII